MGKAGEKQKRTPKIKDKKQSERFKEAAREIGAEEGTDALERIVEQMTKGQAESERQILRRPISPPTQQNRDSNRHRPIRSWRGTISVARPFRSSPRPSQSLT